MRIFVDLDGVVADFHTAAMRLFRPGWTEDEWPRGQDWVPRVLGVTDEEFWQRCDADLGFWLDIEPYAWMHEFVTRLDALDETGFVTFLSSPSRHPRSHSGKRAWVTTHFNKHRRLILCSEKSLIAAPGRLLIDDLPRHCDEWGAAGGSAICFARPWNRDIESGPCTGAEWCDFIDLVRTLSNDRS